MKKETVQVFRIDFKSTTSLILLPSEFKNLLDSSIRYGFDLKDVHRCRRMELDPMDFPQREWNG